VTKQDHALVYAQLLKRRPNLRKVFLAQLMPLLAFLRQRFVFVDRESQQTRNHTHQHVIACLNLPERCDAQVILRARKAFQPQPSGVRAQGLLAEFVIAARGAQVGTETAPQLL